MTENSPATLPKPQYKPLRLPDGTLAARYDPLRGVLEVKCQGMKYYFDLTQIERPCYNGEHEQQRTQI